MLFFALTVAAAMAWAVEEKMPRAMLTRLYDHGSSESISLRCAEARAGKEEFFCELRRYRNGVEVANTNLYAKQTNAILDGFLRLVPAEEQKKTELPPATRESSSKSEPVLVWDVAFRGRSVTGKLLHHQMGNKSPTLDAVLSLEGALDSQFYR